MIDWWSRSDRLLGKARSQVVGFQGKIRERSLVGKGAIASIRFSMHSKKRAHYGEKARSQALGFSGKVRERSHYGEKVRSQALGFLLHSKERSLVGKGAIAPLWDVEVM